MLRVGASTHMRVSASLDSTTVYCWYRLYTECKDRCVHSVVCNDVWPLLSSLRLHFPPLTFSANQRTKATMITATAHQTKGINKEQRTSTRENVLRLKGRNQVSWKQLDYTSGLGFRVRLALEVCVCVCVCRQ